MAALLSSNKALDQFLFATTIGNGRDPEQTDTFAVGQRLAESLGPFLYLGFGIFCLLGLAFLTGLPPYLFAVQLVGEHTFLGSLSQIRDVLLHLVKNNKIIYLPQK